MTEQDQPTGAEQNPYVDPEAQAHVTPEANPYVEYEAESLPPEPNPYVEQQTEVPQPEPNPYADEAAPQGAPDETLDSTGPIPAEAIAAAQEVATPEPQFDLDARPGSEVEMGSDTRLSWAARTDVGLVRGHNEDSYLVKNPLFGVCDGMGGHAAGEVASAIAVRAIAEHAPEHADDALLGAAVEAANEAVIEGAQTGAGKPGMGCTATCAIIEGARMAVAHVGDSRIYLLRAGTLVRITHDHSYVEELVDAGEITADEARVHPSRSIITRALGSDPNMYADHFTLDVERGDRVIVCSDGLSSMVPDSDIEAIAVSTATPRECVDDLVSAVLAEGAHDNVTVLVIDVVSDGREEERRRARMRAVGGWIAALAAVAIVASVALALFVSNSWYVSSYAGNVGIFQGTRGALLGIPLSHLDQSTDVSISDLPEATQRQLAMGISVSSKSEAVAMVDAYRSQIQEERAKKEQVASDAQSESSGEAVGDPDGAAGPESTTAATTDNGQAQTTQGGE